MEEMAYGNFHMDPMTGLLRHVNVKRYNPEDLIYSPAMTSTSLKHGTNYGVYVKFGNQ